MENGRPLKRKRPREPKVTEAPPFCIQGDVDDLRLSVVDIAQSPKPGETSRHRCVLRAPVNASDFPPKDRHRLLMGDTLRTSENVVRYRIYNVL